MVGPARYSESRASSVRLTVLLVNKNGARKYMCVYWYQVGHSNLDLKCSCTLDYIASLFLSLIYALHGLAVRAIQLFSGWFAKEANVANNYND